MNRNLVAFIKGKIVKEKYSEKNPEPKLLASLLGRCGFGLSKNLKGYISSDYEKELISDILPYLSEIYDPETTWTSVYTNPETPREMDEFDLRLDQILVYINPDYIELTRDQDEEELWNKNRYKITKIISGCTRDEFKRISTTILSSSIIPGEQDLKILDWFINEGEKYIEIPEKIEQKEILSRVLKKNPYIFKTMITSITDILRLVFYINGQGTSLDFDKSQKIKLSNPERRIICYLINYYFDQKKVLCLWDAKRYYNQWRIIGNILHTKKEKYPSAYQFFFELRNHKARSWWNNSWSSQIRQKYDTGSLEEVIQLYSQRSGEFIRHLDSLLRRSWKNKDQKSQDLLFGTLMTLQDITPKTILGLLGYYDTRNKQIPRSYLNKKGVRQFYDSLEPLDQDIIELVKSCLWNKLSDIYSSRESLKGKKVVLNIPRGEVLSLSLRNNQSESTDIILSGHKEYFEPGKIYRLFSQWIDPVGMEDLDIHAYLVSDKNNSITSVGWNGQFRTPSITFSGDVRMRRGNCAEYITIDTSKFEKEIPGTRYIFGFVDNFQRRNLDTLENYVGISEVPNLKTPVSGNTIFRSKVETKYKTILGFIVDLEENYFKVIMEGMNLPGEGYDMEKEVNQLLSYCQDKKPDLYDILTLNIEARNGAIISMEDYMKEPENEKENYIIIDSKNYEKLYEILL